MMHGLFPLHGARRSRGTLLVFAAALLLATGYSFPRFTDKQLEALEQYVGKNYWVSDGEQKRPLFFSAPSPSAPPLFPENKESFLMTELLRGAQSFYYYKVKFDSGREGYLSVDSFLEQLNAAILTRDPDQWQKEKAAKEAAEKREREAAIRAKPWSPDVKEAVLQRKAILGMSKEETEAALGKPRSTVKVDSSSPLLGQQEQWMYGNGVLTFTNGLITRIQTLDGKPK